MSILVMLALSLVAHDPLQPSAVERLCYAGAIFGSGSIWDVSRAESRGGSTNVIDASRIDATTTSARTSAARIVSFSARA
jgi:hypothetical protein